ncbi:MAG: restriction endonuclease subunit S [Candidatus Accumulibacter sp.]|uniref:restriction endonuclease subunit S n=1 Tax=Accumulibacter sp. TaxID=2053492 RepID=UPI00287A3779|nr:restriction endonuclease subunit S [Accumulibacter sp.]MDS4012723.1 restriction endonuclease subunit S [Accumulibacter sp.]
MTAAWQTVRISDFGKVVTGKTPSSDRPEEFGDSYPFITPSDIDNTSKLAKTERYLSEAGANTLRNALLPPKAVCVVCIGATIGKVVMTDQPSFTNQQINSVIVDSRRFDPDYIYYLCKGISETFQTFAGGAATPIINKTVFSAIKVKIPDLAAQSKVAAVLSSIDDLIANNQRRIALLESMAEEIYREWFVRMRFPGCERVKTEKGIPAGWSPSNLGSIASFVMGQSPSSEYYNEIGDGLPFHQGVGTYGDRYPTHEVFCSSEGRRAKSGDILFSVRAPVGRLNIADTDLIIGRGLAAMRHKQDFNSFLFYLLKVTFANEDMIGNGSIFNSVGKDELKRHPILNPPTPLIQRFQNIVVPIDSQLATLYASTTQLIAMRDTLLPRLISGKLRVDQLDIQYPPSMNAESMQVT